MDSLIKRPRKQALAESTYPRGQLKMNLKQDHLLDILINRIFEQVPVFSSKETNATNILEKLFDLCQGVIR